MLPILRCRIWLLLEKTQGPTKPIPEMEVRCQNYALWPKFDEKHGRCNFPEQSLDTNTMQKMKLICFTMEKNFRNLPHATIIDFI